MTKHISGRGGRLPAALAFTALGGLAAAFVPVASASADTTPVHTVISTGAMWTADTDVYLQPDGGDMPFWFYISGAGATGGSVTLTSTTDSSKTIQASFGGGDPLNPCWTPRNTTGTNCRATVHFPAGSTPGTWNMTSVDLAEPDGSVYHQPVTASIGAQLKIPSVNLVAGTNPLQASGFALSATTADNRAQNQTVMLSMTASDKLGKITDVYPDMTGSCAGNVTQLTWSGNQVSVPITVPTNATDPCTITDIMVTDDSQRMVDYPGSTQLTITPTQKPTSTISVDGLSYQHQSSLAGGNVPVSFNVSDSTAISQVTVTAQGPNANSSCAATASTSYPSATYSTSAALSLPFAAASTVQTQSGPQPVGCQPGLYGLDIAVTDINGVHHFGAAGTPLSTPADISVGSAGTYVALPPQRVLDTRGGQTLSGRGVLPLKVAGTGSIPANAVAVVMNVTATNATDAGYVTVYPAGQANPGTSNLNHTVGQTIPNMVTVQVGTGGSVDFLNGSDGRLDLVADVTGYYVPDTSGAVYTGLSPRRALDTRPGHVPARGTVTLNLCSTAGIPAAATAAALNVTVTGPGDQGFLTVYPHGQALPNASSLNFTPGQTIPNMVIASLGANCSVDIFSSAFAPVDVVVDTMGYFLPDTTGQTADGVLVTGAPERLYDTRPANKPILGGTSLSGWGLKPQDWSISSLLLNVTATDPTGDSFVTVYPDAAPATSAPTGAGLPNASNLNFTAGQTIPNMVNATVGDNGYVDFFNHVGSTDLVVDLFGYYTSGSGSGAAAGPAASGRVANLTTGSTATGSTATGGTTTGSTTTADPLRALASAARSTTATRP